MYSHKQHISTLHFFFFALYTQSPAKCALPLATKQVCFSIACKLQIIASEDIGSPAICFSSLANAQLYLWSAYGLFVNSFVIGGLLASCDHSPKNSILRN